MRRYAFRESPGVRHFIEVPDKDQVTDGKPFKDSGHPPEESGVNDDHLGQTVLERSV